MATEVFVSGAYQNYLYAYIDDIIGFGDSEKTNPTRDEFSPLIQIESLISCDPVNLFIRAFRSGLERDSRDR